MANNNNDIKDTNNTEGGFGKAVYLWYLSLY